MGILSRIIDWPIKQFFPERALQRAHARARLKRGESYAASQAKELWRNFRETSLSANADLNNSIDRLRQRSRQAYRDYPAMRAGIDARVGIVIATGIDLEPNTGNEDDDKKLREVWRMYEEEVDASGQLHFKEMQRQAFRSSDLNGAACFQFVTLDEPERLIPLALHSFEADQLSSTQVKNIEKGNTFSQGVESNKFKKPIWYHIIDHPGDSGLVGMQLHQKGERIAAEDIIHVFEQLRPGQTTGEPLGSTILQRIIQEEDLIEAELISAQIGSAFAVTISSEVEEEDALDMDEVEGESNKDAAGNEVMSITAGAILKLNKGEKANTIQNTRPSQQIAPFRAMLRGDIAAAIGISRTDLDKDYSKANYSSMRSAMLDKRRLLTPIQNWFGRALVSRLYKRAFPLLAVRAGVDLAKEGTIQRKRQERHLLIPDGWEYVDPQKDIGAALMAIHGGLSNFKLEIGQRGRDMREVHEELSKELKNPLHKDLIELYDVARSESQTQSTQTQEDN